MDRKMIDLSQYAVAPSETFIRKIFFRDEELRFLYFIINNEQPITVPELMRRYNQLFSTLHERSWVYGKLEKI